jgi:hypothetical protein
MINDSWALASWSGSKYINPHKARTPYGPSAKSEAYELQDTARSEAGIAGYLHTWVLKHSKLG